METEPTERRRPSLYSLDGVGHVTYQHVCAPLHSRDAETE